MNAYNNNKISAFVYDISAISLEKSLFLLCIMHYKCDLEGFGDDNFPQSPLSAVKLR